MCKSSYVGWGTPDSSETVRIRVQSQRDQTPHTRDSMLDVSTTTIQELTDVSVDEPPAGSVRQYLLHQDGTGAN